MSMLLFIIGGIAVMVGAAMVAFGVPINEFSFGNTLIVSGSTVGTGGLIIIAIAAAVSRLNRIAEAIAQRAEPFPHEALEAPPEAHGVEAPGRMPFPPRTRGVTPLAAESAAEEAAAPALRNPEAPPVPEEVALAPHGEAADRCRRRPVSPCPGGRQHRRLRRRSNPPSSRPGASASRRRGAISTPCGPSSRPSRRRARQAEPEPAPEPPPPPPELPAAEMPRTIAVLKSGVVDGMGYTLYVDGSIEAELPQGTLRFASIDELRAHLEKGP